MPEPRDALLKRVVAFVARDGLTGRSLRQIAEGAGTSHRMLLYHFESRAGLLSAIGSEVERQQRSTMAEIATSAATPSEVLLRVWDEVSAQEMSSFVALFFDIVSQAIQHRPGTESFRNRLTEPWIEQARRAVDHADFNVTDADLRLAIAATRGLLIDLQTGGDPDAIEAALRRLGDLWDQNL